LGFALLLLSIAALVHAQGTPVTAEAINQANLRAQPGTEFDKVGEILSGTRYPVIGRSEFYPWILLADPNTRQPLGWVFNDLMQVQGDVFSVPLSQQVVDPHAQPTATIAPTQPILPMDVTATPAIGAPTATATPVSSVMGRVQGEINLRYGPGTEYDRIGVAEAGNQFPITARHATLPWVQIGYPNSPNGYAWVATDLLDIQGDLNSVPIISQTSFYLPTLTPTASVAERAAVGQVSPEFAALGGKLWSRMIDAEFDPATSRFGGLFLQNLKTGETLAFESDIAFSGMSINKIAILVTLFGRINDTPDDPTANLIAEMMICSENISTNKVLAVIGDGNPYTGAERVSEFLQKLGLNDTFIYTPYSNDPFITPQAPRTRQTNADQIKAEPDPYNQMTVTEMGALLHAMYQCAVTEDGPLLANFNGAYTPLECRKMLDVMTYNHIYNFIEAGVPDGVKVAHKHGWVNDTDGDAGIVFSPGGDYIFVNVLHEPTWLVFEEAGTVISENSLDIYNYFNPTAPLDEVHAQGVPECNLLGNQAIIDLLSPTFGETALFQ
jgi:uncharacterized protein YraI/beta-lactamase class A